MTKIQFENGKIVEFATTPTSADIDEVAKSLGIKPKDNRSTFQKVADTSGNILDKATEYTGIKSAVDLLGTAGEGFQYAANKAIEKTPLFPKGMREEAKRANDYLLVHPQSKAMKVANEKGTGAGLKVVAGETLDIGLSALPFAKVGGVLLTTAKVTKGAPFMKNLAALSKVGAGYGSGYGVSESLKDNATARETIANAVIGGSIGAFAAVVPFVGLKVMEKSINIPLGWASKAGTGIQKISTKIEEKEAVKTAAIIAEEEKKLQDSTIRVTYGTLPGATKEEAIELTKLIAPVIQKYKHIMPIFAGLASGHIGVWAGWEAIQVALQLISKSGRAEMLSQIPKYSPKVSSLLLKAEKLKIPEISTKKLNAYAIPLFNLIYNKELKSSENYE